MSGFDQHNRAHQDWLLKFVAQQPPQQPALTGFYETQDLADLLQGRQRGEIASTVDNYRKMKQAMSPKEFFCWLRGQRSEAGINVPSWWQDAEDNARLMEITDGQQG